MYSPQPSSEVLNLIHGDAYDGIANSKLVWIATRDVDGEDINFTIRDGSDIIIIDQDTDGVVTSAVENTVAVSLSSEATALLNPHSSILKFDVEVEFSATSRWTIARGTACVEMDQSR